MMESESLGRLPRLHSLTFSGSFSRIAPPEGVASAQMQIVLDCISQVPFDPSKVQSPMRDYKKSKVRAQAEKLGLRTV